jgi:putative component of toxin-antitoxin plasmid stabilization module
MQRALSLKDPWLFKKYREYLHNIFAKHKVQEKCKALQQSSVKGDWTPRHEEIYHRLDGTITRAMLSAEKSLRKACSSKLSCSPKLKPCKPTGSDD